MKQKTIVAGFIFLMSTTASAGTCKIESHRFLGLQWDYYVTLQDSHSSRPVRLECTPISTEQPSIMSCNQKFGSQSVGVGMISFNFNLNGNGQGVPVYMTNAQVESYMKGDSQFEGTLCTVEPGTSHP